MKNSSFIIYLSFFVFLTVLGLTIFSFIFPFHTRFDFNIYLLAARAVLRGTILYPIPYHNTTFTYPPSVLPFLVPFVFFRPDVAASLWNTLSLLATLTSVWLLLTVGHKKLPLQYIFTLFALVLILPPVRSTLQYGQVNAVVLLLILLAFLVSQKKSSIKYSAGLLLGIAAALKMFPLFLLFYFVVKRQWHVLLVTPCVFFLFLIGGTFGHWQYITDYVQYAHTLMAHRQILFGDQSFPMIILLYFPFLHAVLSQVTIAAYTFFVGISFFFWEKSTKGRLSDFVFYNELLATTILIVMPYAWTHHLIFLLPLAWSLFLRVWNTSTSKWSVALFVFLTISFFMSTSFVNDFLVSFWLEPQALSFHSIFGLFMLFLGKFLAKRPLFALLQTP